MIAVSEALVVVVNYDQAVSGFDVDFVPAEIHRHSSLTW